MRIAIGADHRGVELKKTVIGLLEAAGYEYEDFGSYSTESVDFPDFAARVASGVAGGDCERGILICDTGIGMCIALCYNVFNARRARQHNNANILCLGAGEGELQDPVDEIVDAFLTTEFEGGRHQRRIDKITAMEDR
jgi:RpiB/LacA/LacB family sugar-phosphate isomerase